MQSAFTIPERSDAKIMDSVIATEIRHILEKHELPASEFTMSDGFANLVVLTPTHVVRLNEGRFPQAFAHEARVLARLPQDIPHPVAVASGHRDMGGEYLVLERLPGANLETVWETMTRVQQRHVISHLASIMEQVHALAPADWMRNPWVEDTLTNKRWRDAYHAPPSMAMDLVESAMTVRPDVHRLLAQICHFIGKRLSAWGHEPIRFVHIDLHFRNVIVADGHISGVIDFEGSRLAPIDVELDMLIRSLGSQTQRSDARYGDVIPTVRSAYPALFAHPSLIDRLEVYEALWNLVQLHHWRPRDRWMKDPAESLSRLLNGAFATHLSGLLGD